MGERGTILVVEDNATTARTLRLFLEARGYRSLWAADGRAALDLFGSQPVNLVLLDLMLPDVGGIEVCRSIRQRSTIPIVMLTAKTAEDDVVVGLESGADDYVRKPFGSRELLARIRRCLDRRPNGGDDDALQAGEVRLDPRRRSVAVAGSTVRLTRTEFEILHVLMRSPGRVFTRRQLIERALGEDWSGLDRTIDTHVWSLRKKLGEPRGRPRLVLAEPGVGYRLSDGDAA